MPRISARIEPIDRDIQVFLNETLSPEARSRQLARFAEEQIELAQQQNKQVLGRVLPYTQTVDGRVGADLRSVKPEGVIVAEFELINSSLQWIEDQLVKHSPFKTGQYIRSHVLFADGQEVPFGVDIPIAEEYIFINEQPYARKIERGLSSQSPHGVYQAVATLAQGRFGNQARIRFSFRAFPHPSSIGTWSERTSLGARIRDKSRRSEWLRRQPAIVITPRG